MKRILIVSHAMELGGAERSLIGLLGAVDSELFHVDLFLLRHEGELLSQIPDSINLLPPISAYTVLERPMMKTLSEGHVLLTAGRLYGKLKAKHYSKKVGCQESDVAIEYSHKYTYRFMPSIQPDIEYDMAISFLTPHYIVANKVRAKKKIAWIHTDYSNIQIDVTSETKMWAAYDHIVSISEKVSESFARKFPTLENRLMIIENILPSKLILEQANEFEVSDEMPKNDAVRLLSIGRFCTAKNFDNIPNICAKLISLGIDVKWYIIGYGGDASLIKQKIVEEHMENNVIILGKKNNPYPYIKACDIYVQPSRFEGKSVSVREAQLLGKPVVITAFPTSTSQLEDGVDGMIVPLDNEGCAQGIASVVRNQDLKKKMVINCGWRDYSNAQEIEKLYELIG